MVLSPQNRSFLDPTFIVGQLSFISPGMLIADFGCGGGFFTLVLAKRLGYAGHIYAVDVQQEALNVVKEKATANGLSNIETIRANLEQTKGTQLRDYSLDLVWMVNLLFQNTNKEAIFKEAFRVLKTGGMLVVIDWIPNLPIGPDGYRVSKEEVADIAKKIGFTFNQVIQTGQYHHGSVFIKASQ